MKLDDQDEQLPVEEEQLGGLQGVGAELNDNMWIGGGRRKQAWAAMPPPPPVTPEGRRRRAGPDQGALGLHRWIRGLLLLQKH